MASESGLGGGDARAFGRFELSSELHKGYFGPLWLGRCVSGDEAGTLVAVRRIEVGGEVGDGAATTVAQAAERASAVEHEKLVRILEAVRDEGELVIVSEYQAAEPVRALLRLAGLGRKPVPPAVAARIAIDVLEACVALHDHDVLASLSPDNILVGADGVTRVLEPVVSHAASQEAVWKEQPKRAIYAAPEQFGDDAGDARSDVFSLGVILWEMLRNRALFGGSTFAQVSERVRTAAIGRADALKPAGGEAIPKPIADVVEKALQRKPEARFATAADMLAELRSCQPASQADVARFARELLGEAFSLQERKAAAALRAGAEPTRRSSAASARPTPPMKSTPAPAPVAKKREAKKTLVGMAAPTSLRFQNAESEGTHDDEHAESGHHGGYDDDGIDVDTSDDQDSLDDVTSNDDAPRARSSRRSLRGRAPSGYDMMSIADDPSISDSMDEEAEAALRRVRQAPSSRRAAVSSDPPRPPAASGSLKTVVLVAAGVIVVGVAVIVGMKLGGGGDAAATRDAASAVVAVPTSAPAAPGAPVATTPVEDKQAATAPAATSAATVATPATAAPAAPPPAAPAPAAPPPVTRPAPVSNPYAAPPAKPAPAPAKPAPAKPGGGAKPSFNPYDI